MATTFGSLIRSYRLRAGLGLRTFAALIDERASVVSAIESSRRAPWRHEANLGRVAEVLGFAESSALWEKILGLARQKHAQNLPAGDGACGEVAWWWQTENAPELDQPNLAELANFVGAKIDLESSDGSLATIPSLTELAIEWRVRRLLGRRETQISTAPVDVEAVVENELGVRLEIVPGLIPRFSVQAYLVRNQEGLVCFVDRIVADSRPMASYRQLLALSLAPAALWQAETSWQAADFRTLLAGERWPLQLRDCQRFALALLLPANPVLAGAESAYTELVQQQGWIEIDDAARGVRNRLAEQFAVPPALVHRRLLGWPCHLYGRIAQALAANEVTLPPLDWLVDQEALRQRTFFDESSRR